MAADPSFRYWTSGDSVLYEGNLQAERDSEHDAGEPVYPPGRHGNAESAHGTPGPETEGLPAEMADFGRGEEYGTDRIDGEKPVKILVIIVVAAIAVIALA